MFKKIPTFPMNNFVRHKSFPIQKQLYSLRMRFIRDCFRVYSKRKKKVSFFDFSMGFACDLRNWIEMNLQNVCYDVISQTIVSISV